MPFSEPTPLTIQVTQSDIDAAGTSSTTNSLATAINRYIANNLLPGQENDTSPQNCSALVAINPRIMNGQVVSVIDAFACTRNYSCDLTVTLIIVLESIGIKPSAPYTATLVHS